MIAHTLTSGKDAWVHKGGHTEVSQNKQEDDSIVNGDSHREVLRKPRAAGKEREDTITISFDHECQDQNRTGREMAILYIMFLVMFMGPDRFLYILQIGFFSLTFIRDVGSSSGI